LNSLPYTTQQQNIIPDLKGLGLKDAIYLLENLGLKVNAGGKGKVMYQSLIAGTNFNRGQAINIQLN
jgi:cell division protein FtsI (penicillin-binding protein 3)